MKPTRRELVGWGGAALAALPVLRVPARAADAVEISMGGRGAGAVVWFDPVGLLIEPGQTVRWINDDPANTHTATAYHPDNFGKPRRIPEGAQSWNSRFLMPGESFELTLTEEGVYDYYCMPHEAAGMVGRIIVGRSVPAEWPPTGERALASGVESAFPSIEDILEQGAIPGEG